MKENYFTQLTSLLCTLIASQHDCDPNCNFMPVGADVICFKALKPIDVNEEITTYYGDNYFGVGNQECLCATCERYIE